MALDPVIILAGPTASGKSDLGLELAKCCGGVIINADSLQVYRELRILTARPDARSEAAVSHRLYGTVSATERFSVGEWLALARREIDLVHEDGALPIFVGGSGLYIRSLVSGIAGIPKITTAARLAATELYGEIGESQFRARLAERDPSVEARVQGGDKQRLIRAWEVLVATGKPISEWQSGENLGGLKCPYFVITIMPQRAKLYRSCDERFETMLNAGALDEVAILSRLGLDPSLPAMKALGLRALTRYLKGDLSLDNARQLACKATRNYAKRQNTWFRNQLTSHIEVEDPVVYKDEVIAAVTRFLLTASCQRTSVPPFPATLGVGKS